MADVEHTGRPRVAVCDDYERAMTSDPAWDAVRARARCTVFDKPFEDREAAARALEPFDAICLVRERLPVPRSLIDALPRLRFVAFTGERNPSCDHAAAAARGIPVSNTTGGPAKASTAETAWALILAGMRQLVRADTGMRAGHWRADASGAAYPLPGVLAGERLGLLGLGQIGQRVGQVGKAFGMEVVAWSPNLTAERAAEAGVAMVSKRELFETSRVVSISLVLSDRTRGIVAADELALMRTDAIIVNTSRAGLMPEGPLREALLSGRPGHAGLDVFEHEPAGADLTLAAMPQVTLSPHLGYVNDAVFAAFSKGMAEVVLAWLDGRPIRVVNAVP